MTGLGSLKRRLRGMTPRFDKGNCDKKVAEGVMVNKWVGKKSGLSEGKRHLFAFI